MQQPDQVVQDHGRRLAGGLGIAVRDLHRDLLVVAEHHRRFVIAVIDQRIVQAAEARARIERDERKAVALDHVDDDVGLPAGVVLGLRRPWGFPLCCARTGMRGKKRRESQGQRRSRQGTRSGPAVARIASRRRGPSNPRRWSSAMDRACARLRNGAATSARRPPCRRSRAASGRPRSRASAAARPSIGVISSLRLLGLGQELLVLHRVHEGLAQRVDAVLRECRAAPG